MKSTPRPGAVRRSASLVLSLAMGLTLTAQKIEWGPKLDLHKTYTPIILGEDENYFYSTFYIKDQPFKDGHIDIEKYDKITKQRVYTQKLDLSVLGGNDLNDVIFTGENFVTLHSSYDKKQQESTMYANIYSASSGNNVAKNKVVVSVPQEKKARRVSFTSQVSENGKRILLTHKAYYKKQDKTRERFLLFDEQFNKLTEREDVTEGRTSGSGVSELALDDDGSFYFMKKNEDGSTKIVTYDANRDFDKWEETINLKKIGLPVTGYIYNQSATTTRKKDLVIAGYYSRNGESLDGTYFLKIDGRSKEIVVQKLNDFDQAFKDQFRSKKDIEKGRSGEVRQVKKSSVVFGTDKLYDKMFGAMRLYKKDDGGIVGIGEVKNLWVAYDGNGVPSRVKYFFGDMIAVNFDDNGDLTWAHRLKKSQQFGYTRSGPFIFSSTGFKLFHASWKPVDYMSYFAALGKDKFYVAYNDNARNLQKKSDQDKLTPFKKPTEAVMSIYAIDLNTGEKKKTAFFGGKDYSITVEPNTAFQSKQNSQPIIMGSRKKDFKFGLMQLD